MKALKYGLVLLFGLMAMSCADDAVAPLKGGEDDDGPPVIIPPKTNSTGSGDSTGRVATIVYM